MKAILIGGFFVIALSSPSLAQTSATCAALLRSYEFESKSASLSWAEGVADNSAPRATLRNLEIQNHLLVKQMNLTLMLQHKCALPIEPVGMNEYPTDALKCSTASMKAQMAGRRDSPAECDMSSWSKKH